ncbi:hypothetical protein AHIS1636_28920 [Arthrobacter mangrovi]|uniref:Secreted protein n=1 Tax=Arthrobacter mangrovi TaxID=2966350 RepID=A0ABQ5MWS5_9MICC|nr:hypothetical protein AHIS1636_28920 [Arthrobacter mangrovi]
MFLVASAWAGALLAISEGLIGDPLLIEIPSRICGYSDVPAARREAPGSVLFCNKKTPPSRLAPMGFRA